MKKILVTGGAGFIGTNFIHYWRKTHPQDAIVVLDALTYAGKIENLAAYQSQAGFRFIQGNINDMDLVTQILQAENIDTIVHIAAESHVDRSITGPDLFIETNIVGTHQLLKAAKKVWIDQNQLNQSYRFHHVSTDEVYGSLSATAPAFTETTAYAPNSPYSASKAGSDHLVRAYHHTYGLPMTISNCSNNYGPYQFPEKFIPVLIHQALAGKDLPVYGDGKNIRDWLYVDDHCRGIDLVLQHGKNGEVYNIGGNNERTNLEVVQAITTLIDQLFQKDPELKHRFPSCPAAQGNITASLLKFVKDRPGHDRRYAINPFKIHSELGYSPQVSFSAGLEQTIHWYLAQQSMQTIEVAA